MFGITKDLAGILVKEFNKDKVLSTKIECINYTHREVIVVHLKAIKRKIGTDVASMKKLIEVADKHDIDLMFIPRTDLGSRQHECSSGLFKQFGFRFDSAGIIMRRHAKNS